MSYKIKNIIIPQLDTGRPNTAIDLYDCNTDIIVMVEKEDETGIVKLNKFTAPFITYRNVETLINTHKANGQFLNGKYFWAKNMLLIENCSYDDVQLVVKHLIEEGDFELVFRLL